MKYAIIGNSGSGKSTLASRMGEEVGGTPIDLDDIYWEPDRPGTHSGTFPHFLVCSGAFLNYPNDPQLPDGSRSLGARSIGPPSAATVAVVATDGGGGHPHGWLAAIGSATGGADRERVGTAAQKGREG